ncbi:MAG: hypothetical protein JSS32_07825 [Verrucomicrobia bacterium]|nr:hypothetical protein [Verrucomicrobiota bacterium]
MNRNFEIALQNCALRVKDKPRLVQMQEIVNFIMVRKPHVQIPSGTFERLCKFGPKLCREGASCLFAKSQALVDSLKYMKWYSEKVKLDPDFKKDACRRVKCQYGYKNCWFYHKDDEPRVQKLERPPVIKPNKPPERNAENIPLSNGFDLLADLSPETELESDTDEETPKPNQYTIIEPPKYTDDDVKSFITQAEMRSHASDVRNERETPFASRRNSWELSSSNSPQFTYTILPKQHFAGVGQSSSDVSLDPNAANDCLGTAFLSNLAHPADYFGNLDPRLLVALEES